MTDKMHGISLLWARFVRIILHIFSPIRDLYLADLIKRTPALFYIHYLCEIPFLLLDLIFFPEIFNFFQSIFKRNARHLNEEEYQLAHRIFKSTLDLHQVRIDQNTIIGTRGGKYVFVAYYFINSKGNISLPVLMHELVHVLQFKQVGSPYVFRNLIAHTKRPTYDYGGLEKIQDIVKKPGLVNALNYEQRAEIVSDYCQILFNNIPEWGRAHAAHADLYTQVIQLLISKQTGLHSV
jgi:hypothetical protein